MILRVRASWFIVGILVGVAAARANPDHDVRVITLPAPPPKVVVQHRTSIAPRQTPSSCQDAVRRIGQIGRDTSNIATETGSLKDILDKAGENITNRDQAALNRTTEHLIHLSNNAARDEVDRIELAQRLNEDIAQCYVDSGLGPTGKVEP